MKRIGLLLCAFAIAFSLAGQESSLDTQAGNFLFKTPAGWDRRDKGDTTFLIAPKTSDGTGALIALTADEVQTDLRTSFNAEWEGFKRQYQVTGGGEIVSGRLPNGYEAYSTNAHAIDKNGIAWTVFVSAANYRNRVQTVVFMSTATGPQLERVQRVLREFLATLRFKAAAAPPPPSPAETASRQSAPGREPEGASGTQGKLDGIYRGLGTTEGGRLGFKYVVFFPDGRFKESLVDQGLDHLNEEAEIRAHSVGWGNYESNGKMGRIVFPPDEYSNQPIVWQFLEHSPEEVELHGGTYTRLDPCNDLRLEGTFRRSDYQIAYSPRQGITFTRDGRFADEGVLAAAGVMIRNATGGFDFDDGAPGSGSYRIANYTLQLTYANGRVKRTNFYIEPGTSKENVREFYLNTWKFVRVQ